MYLDYYYNRIKTDFFSLIKSYSWHNAESVFAFRTAIACILSMLTAYLLEFQQAYWASISCLIVSLPTAGATAKKALYRFFGTCAGAVSAVIISGLFAQYHICYSIAIFLLISVCFYISVFSKYSYFWFLLAVTAAIIMISTIAKNVPEDIVYFAYNRWFEVSIGIAVTSFLNLLAWPHYAAHDYHKKSREINRNYSDFLQNVFEQYLSGEYDEEKIRTDFNSLNSKIQTLNNIVENAKFELKTARRQKSIIILDTKQLTLNLNHIWDFFLSIKKFNYLSFHKSFCQYIREILNTSVELNNIKNDSDKKSELINQLNSYIEQINKRYLKNKARGENKEHEINDVLLFQEFLIILKEFVDFSKNKMFFNSKTFLSSGSKLISYFPEEIYSLNIFGKTMYLSIPILKYSVKVGISVVAVIWLWQFFEIPSGGSNMAVAVLLVMQPDTVTTYMKGLLRFLGCLAGALTGFAFLFFQIQSTFLLCLFLLVIIYFAMYVYYKGGTGISYAGLQMSLAFLIAALPEPHATMDTILFINRLIGIFFGVSVAWLINISIFSKDILSAFKEKLSFLENKVSSSVMQLRNFKNDIFIPDLSSFYTSLNIITDQKEISAENSFFINKYFTNIEKFFRIRYLLLCIEKEAVEFVDQLKPDIRRNIIDMVSNFAIKKDQLKEIELKIKSSLQMIEELRIKVRYNNLTDNKSFECRQHYCLYIVNLKRMLLTLSELYQIQEKINI